LPPSHFGSRKRQSAEDPIVCVVDEIKVQSLPVTMGLDPN
ncbi:hypothetical protein NBRC10513_006210, partial [Rhodotorula toruloides]